MIPVSIYYRRPIEERVVHALGKAWHVEVTIATHWNNRKHFGTFYNYMFILEVLYSSDRELYWILSVVKKRNQKFSFFTRELFEFQHFVCAKCERPFFGTRHYEKKGLAYCETHYHQVCFQNKLCVREVCMMREVENDILRCYCFHTVSVYIKGSVIEIPYRHTVHLLWLK